MYGKTLADFPDRFDEFLEEFEKTPPDVLDEAFRLTRGVCSEFPTPADVRKQVQVASATIERKRLEVESEERSRRALKPPNWIPLKQLEETTQFQALVKKTRA